MKGFVLTKQPQRTSAYWIALYSQDDEDTPFSVSKKVLTYKPGQDKEKLIIQYCRELMRINQTIWELLVHQGSGETPDSGNQIVLRMSREKFNGSTTID